MFGKGIGNEASRRSAFFALFGGEQKGRGSTIKMMSKIRSKRKGKEGLDRSTERNNLPAQCRGTFWSRGAGTSLNPQPIFALVARSSAPELSLPWLIGLAVGAVLVLVIAYKIGKFLLRIAVGLVALAVVAALVWHFWLRS